MLTDIGEYIVGAYLQMERGCDAVSYNVRPPGGKMPGLGEIDVIGFDFKNEKAILCEVTTHIQGLLYKDSKTTLDKIKTKYVRMQEYAIKNLPLFKHEFMFWSPNVPPGLAKALKNDPPFMGLQMIINASYTSEIVNLYDKAKDSTHDLGNPFSRTLQILGHLRKEDKKKLTLS